MATSALTINDGSTIMLGGINNKNLSERVLLLEEKLAALPPLQDRVLAIEQKEQKLTAIYDSNKFHISNYYAFVSIVIAMVGVVIGIMSIYGKVLIDDYVKTALVANTQEKLDEIDGLIQLRLQKAEKESRKLSALLKRVEKDAAQLSQSDEKELTALVTKIDEKPETNRTEDEWLLLVIKLRQENKYTQAINALNKALKNFPENESFWHEKGYLLVKLGLYEESIIASKEALKIDPENSATWNNMGFTLSKLNRHKEAIEDFNKAINFNSKDATPWRNKGTAFERLNDFDAALKAYNKAIELRPTYEKAIADKDALLKKMADK